MLQKENKIQIAIFIAATVFALIQPGYLSIALLVGVASIIFVWNHRVKTSELRVMKHSANKKTEEANDRAEDAFGKLVKLINAIPSPLIFINQRGDFEVMNQYFETMIGIEFKNVYDINIDSPIRQTLLDAFLNEKQFVRQFHYKSVDYQVLSVPILAETQRYLGCMLIFQDVTRVVDGEKVQKRFIADASHELRTPIASIKGMVEILNRPGFSDEETRIDFMQQIQKETNRLDKIVEDLLLQSKLRAKQVYLEKTFFNLNHFFEGILYERRQELHQAEIVSQVDCPVDLEIHADQFRLSQVFLNLINNSINYAKGGMIRIKARRHKKAIVIHFKDDGEGMSEDLVPHIFERFYRGEFSRARDSGGSGLGLAISKSIVEGHGGTIEVQSKIHEGTEFIITLPL